MATYWSDMAHRATYLYRLYAADDSLLYVGISMNILGRFAKHRRRDWWPEVAYWDLEQHANRTLALMAERYAIHHENPRHNLTRPRMECC